MGITYKAPPTKTVAADKLRPVNASLPRSTKFVMDDHNKDDEGDAGGGSSWMEDDVLDLDLEDEPEEKTPSGRAHREKRPPKVKRGLQKIGAVKLPVHDD
jgi:hypothetical protein